MKLLAALAALTLVSAPAQAGGYSNFHNTTYTDQVKVCRRVPARKTGYVKVGNNVQDIITPAHNKCHWEDSTRTVVEGFSHGYVRGYNRF